MTIWIKQITRSKIVILKGINVLKAFVHVTCHITFQDRCPSVLVYTVTFKE